MGVEHAESTDAIPSRMLEDKCVTFDLPPEEDTTNSLNETDLDDLIRILTNDCVKYYNDMAEVLQLLLRSKFFCDADATQPTLTQIRCLIMC